MLVLVGGILLAVGVILFGMPFIAVPMAMGSGSFDGVASSFAFAFPGIILIAIGGMMLKFGLLKPVAEIVATETGGAVEHSSAATGRGLARGLREGGLAVGGPQVKVRCRSCGGLDSEDARFCSSCGKGM